MLKFRKHNLFYSFATCFCLLLSGVVGINLGKIEKNEVFADVNETIYTADYFKACNSKTGKTYVNGDTIFLDSGTDSEREKLVITFGEPVGTAVLGDETKYFIYDSTTEIGEYALDPDFLNCKLTYQTFSGTPEGEDKEKSYEYIPDYASNETTVQYCYENNVSFDDYNIAHKTLAYYTFEIDLSQTNYSGQYDIEFEYKAYTGTDFSISKTITFKTTFYIFNTTDYFSTNDATSQNSVMSDVRTVTPLNASYNNYYFYNYTNYEKNNDLSNSYLPTLTYNAKYFNVTIVKTYQGVSQSMTISEATAEPYYTLGSSTNKNFVEVNKIDNNFVLTFFDIGEYIITYEYVYKNTQGTYIKLASEEITQVTNKQDVLYLFGYQLFYFDKDDCDNKEFKNISSDNKTSGDSSADVSYKIKYENLASDSVKTTTFDDNIKTALLSGEELINPASTNQSAISVRFNVSLDKDNSYYYKWNKSTNEWENKTSYQNASLADTGTYLLKVVYTFDKNIDGNGTSQPSQTYCQYFFFQITTTTATTSISELQDLDNNGIIDDSEKTAIPTNYFTKNDVEVSISGQSIFNSKVTLNVYTKDFGTNIDSYEIEETLYGSNIAQSITFTENKNYKVVLTYGKNQSIASLFTIDKTSFSNVRIYNVENSYISSDFYVKKTNYYVDFFTQNSVTVQWDEKLSGATSVGYYKFIPFKQISAYEENWHEFNNNHAIPTNYALDYDDTILQTALCYNSANESILSSKYVFTEQGLYIIKITDDAGNWQYITFCIDKTDINIWQCLQSDYTYQTTHSNNIVSANTYIQWGEHKLISTGIYSNKISEICDEWLKDILTAKYAADDGDLYVNDYDSQKIYLASEISSTCFIKEGNTFIKHTGGTAINQLLIELSTTISDYTFTKELTYTIYLIDESNTEFFKKAQSLTTEEFVQNCDRSYSVTATSDSSEVEFFINNSNQSENDLSTISFDSYALGKVGFTDSASDTTSNTIDMRSLYYASTGITAFGDVSLLTIKANLNPSSLLTTKTIVMYYYPFDSNTYEISSEPTRTILYNNEGTQVLTRLTGDYNGCYAYNINPSYNSSKNCYETLEGKYVFVRIYTDDSNVNENDFLIREYSFIIERQKIVSTPTNVGGEYVSIVGQNIYINVLDGLTNQLKFDDMYKAYSYSESILSTNKLPVVLYVPINKFGSITDETNNTFTANQTIQYYYDVTREITGIYTIKKHLASEVSTAKLIYSYFGDNLVSSNFTSDLNYARIKNASFDLSVKIEYSETKNGTRTTIYTQKTSDEKNIGYFLSSKLSDAGYYYVTITQNALNGSNTYPNSYATFSFSYQIILKAPTFDFTTTDGDELDSDLEQLSLTSPNPSEDKITYYTNQDTVVVTWTESTDEYIAKINLTDNGSGQASGIYYYVNSQTTKHYIPLNSITISNNNKTYSFEIDISDFSDGSVVYVYMEYEVGSNYQTKGVTNLTKKIYIDRQAPTQVLSKILQLNTPTNSAIELLDVFDYVQTGDDENSKKYCLPTQSNSILSGYKLTVNLEGNSAPLLVMQNAIRGFYTEGYYFYCKTFDHDITASEIEIAKDAYANYTLVSNMTTFLTGASNFYEIVEKDLAGNITIYIVRFVNNEVSSDSTVLEYEKPTFEDSVSKTISPEGPLTYEQLLNTSNIFAKNNFDITRINLWDNEWVSIVVDGKEYLTSPNLASNQLYSLNNWVNTLETPEIVTLNDILSYTSSRVKHTLTIVNPTTEENFNLNIYVSNETLDLTTAVTVNNKQKEGITITGVQYTNGAYVIPHTVIIKKHVRNSYETIYEGAITFASNSNITFTQSSNTWSFAINNYTDTDSFEYIIYDNFGQKYIQSHTVNEPVIEDEVLGDLGVITVSDDDGLNDWFVSNENMTFLYSSVDYRIFLQFDYLTLIDGTLTMAHYPATTTSETERKFGVEITSDTFSERSTFFAVESNLSTSTIGKIILKQQTNIAGLEGFSGNIVKYTLTLINSHKSTDEAFNDEYISQKHFVIDNLTPNTYLYNKNGDIRSIDDSYQTFFGEIVVKFNSLASLEIPINEDFVFECKHTVTYDTNDEVEINTNTAISEPGQYTLKTYLKINDVYYECSKIVFAISESSKEFYTISVMNSETGKIEYLSPTQNGYTDEHGNYYSCHYIVNRLDYTITPNEEQNITVTIDDTASTEETTIYTITNKDAESPLESSINYYTKRIAISYISSNSIISKFAYNETDINQADLTGTSKEVIISEENPEYTSLQIFYNTYYKIKENIITPVIVSDNEINVENICTQISDTISCLTLSKSGYYSISFKDVAGNVHYFTDSLYGYKDKYYQILFINGVAFNINNNAPIQNAVYNDEIEISLPTTLENIYDQGGKPKISVLRNGEEYQVSKNENETYTISEPGYYTVWFEAKVKDKNLNKQTYSFIILNKNEYRAAFEYSRYSNYEITEIIKDGVKQDYSNYFDNQSLQISAYDTITGVGEYQVTIKTNSEIKDEQFTFSFKINKIEIVPIQVSVAEGTSTSKQILVSFNAYDLFSKYGEVNVLIGNKKINITEEYLQSLNQNYYISQECTRVGENFIQLQTPSGKILYSYKVTKVEPLNTLSIIFIIVASGVVVAVVVTVVLLRKKMKIK